MSIDAAIKTRWDAKGLSNVITGGIHKGAWVPEETAPPYCLYSVIGNDSTDNSVASQYFTYRSTFKVYATLDTDAETFAQLIADNFQHADRAATNPLSATENIINVQVKQNPLNDQETDNLYTSEIILEITYSKNQNLTPA